MKRTLRIDKTMRPCRLFGVILLSILTLSSFLIFQTKAGYIPEPESWMATIKGDGSVAPESAPILREGNIYTFVGDIEGYVVLERSNCVVDGAGHVVEGVYGPIPMQDGSQWQVNSVAGVTVTNMT